VTVSQRQLPSLVPLVTHMVPLGISVHPVSMNWSLKSAVGSIGLGVAVAIARPLHTSPNPTTTCTSSPSVTHEELASTILGATSVALQPSVQRKNLSVVGGCWVAPIHMGSAGLRM